MKTKKTFLLLFLLNIPFSSLTMEEEDEKSSQSLESVIYSSMPEEQIKAVSSYPKKRNAQPLRDHRKRKKARSELAVKGNQVDEIPELPLEMWSDIFFQHLYHLKSLLHSLRLSKNIYTGFDIAKRKLSPTFRHTSLVSSSFYCINKQIKAKIIECLKSLSHAFKIVPIPYQPLFAARITADYHKFPALFKEFINAKNPPNYHEQISLLEHAVPDYWLRLVELSIFLGHIPNDGLVNWILKYQASVGRLIISHSDLFKILQLLTKCALNPHLCSFQEDFLSDDGSKHGNSSINLLLKIMPKSSLQCIELLLKAGAKGDDTGSEDKRSPLHHIITTFSLNEEEVYKLIQLLLSYHANIDEHDLMTGRTILQLALVNRYRTSCVNPIYAFSNNYAYQNQSSDIVFDYLIHFLLEQGANPNTFSKGNKKATALHSAIAYQAPEEMLKTLIEYGANPYLKNGEGKSSFDLATELTGNDLLARKFEEWYKEYLIERDL